MGGYWWVGVIVLVMVVPVIMGVFGIVGAAKRRAGNAARPASTDAAPFMIGHAGIDDSHHYPGDGHAHGDAVDSGSGDAGGGDGGGGAGE